MNSLPKGWRPLGPRGFEPTTWSLQSNDFINWSTLVCIVEHIPSKDNRQEKSQEVKVLFFARAREIVGLSDTTLKIKDRHGLTTITDCVEHIIQQFPGLQEISSCMLVALNQEYADGSSTVKDGDELALIPPISGG